MLAEEMFEEQLFKKEETYCEIIYTNGDIKIRFSKIMKDIVVQFPGISRKYKPEEAMRYMNGNEWCNCIKKQIQELGWLK